MVWSGQRGAYLCIPASDPPTRVAPTLPRRARRAPILALFAQHGPMTIRTLHDYLPDRGPLTRHHALYVLVDSLRRRGKLIVLAKGSDGVLYCLPPAP